MSTKILAINGSSRRDSLNQKLLRIAARGAVDAGAEVTFVRLADFELPLYDGDLEAGDGLPRGARDLQNLLASHQGLLVATPEYNGGYTALLKNAIDWTSRPRVDGSSGVALFAGKPAALMSASPGQMGGLRSQIAIRAVLDKLGMIVVPQSFALGNAHEAFDDSDRLKDREAARLAAEVGAALSRTVSRLS